MKDQGYEMVGDGEENGESIKGTGSKRGEEGRKAGKRSTLE